MPTRPRTASRRAPLSARLLAQLLDADAPAYAAALAPWRQALCAAVEGQDIVELGPGPRPLWPETGRWTGIDPQAPAPDLPAPPPRLSTRWIAADAAATGLPDASADTVIGSLILCSMADPAAVLAEAARLLRPGGRLALIEHIPAPAGSQMRAQQQIVAPLCRRHAGGCDPARDPLALLAAAGWTLRTLQPFQAPVPILAPHALIVAAPGGKG